MQKSIWRGDSVVEVQGKRSQSVYGQCQLSTAGQKARLGGEWPGRRMRDEAGARACRQPNLVIEFADIN